MTKSIKYIIIDDEKNARDLLNFSIESIDSSFQIVGQASNLLDGVDLIKKLKPQVVFLDVQMPHYTGLKIRDFLSEQDTDFLLIFVTAYDQYSIQAIRLSAFDYLLKPIDINELEICLERVLNSTSQKSSTFHQLNNLSNKDTITLKSHQGTYFVHINDIQYIEASGMYSNFYLNDRKMVISKPLKSYEEIHPCLMRIHRSYIVNTSFIEKIEGPNLILKNKKSLPLSRNKREACINILSNSFNP